MLSFRTKSVTRSKGKLSMKNWIPLGVIHFSYSFKLCFNFSWWRNRSLWPISYMMKCPSLHWGNRGKSVLNIWYASDCSSNKWNVIKNRVGPLHFNSLESSLWKSQQTVERIWRFSSLAPAKQALQRLTASHQVIRGNINTFEALWVVTISRFIIFS
jgi:hypothetical protein